MSVEFAILTATSSEIDRVAELMRHLYEQDSIMFDQPMACAALEKLVAEPDRGIVWVMRDAGAAIGYCVVTFGYSLEFHGVDAFLDELYVSESHRGKGIGRQAIELAERACRERGVRALHVEVERSNTEAQAVYHKLGFADHDRYLLTKWISR